MLFFPWNEVLILHPCKPNILVPIYELFDYGKTVATIHMVLPIMVQSEELRDVVIEYPVAIPPLFNRVFPDPISSRN